MDLIVRFLKFLFRVTVYAVIFTCIIYFGYKYINWSTIKKDLFESNLNIENDIITTSEFSPSTLSLGLDYNGSKWIEDFKAKVNSLGVNVKDIVPTSSNKHVLDVVLDNDMLLKVNTNQKFENIWSNFLLLYNNINFKDELIKGVEYIDLRNENKIYYKLINKAATNTDDILDSDNATNSTSSANSGIE